MKKFLALVLALVMTMSLVTISSSAEFADADSIKYDEAVNTLVSLGVIEGMGGNTFAPEGGVTRAQMAKMITFIGLGVAEADAFEGTKTDLTDVDGHWAEAYIKYCYSQGIIAGKGNGKFDPDAAVTTAEAAKMLLVALGWNADVQGYVGEQWKVNTIRDAFKSKIFEGINLGSDKALNRDEAAKLVYNTVLTNTVDQNPSLDVVDGSVIINFVQNGAPLLTKTFSAYKYEGQMAAVAPTNYNDTTKEYTYNAVGSFTEVEAGLLSETSFSSKNDYTNLAWEEVSVVAKKPATSNKLEVLGIYPTGKSVVMEDVESAFSKESGKVKYNNSLYAVSGAADITPSATSTDVLKFVDADGDGTYEQLVRKAVGAAKVTYASSTEIVTAGGAFKYADDEIASGIVKGDWVSYSKKINGVNVVSKINPVESVAAAIHGKYQKVEFDGSWYNVADKTEYVAGDTYRVWVLNNVIVEKEVVSGIDVSGIVMLTRVDGGEWGTKVEYIDAKGETHTATLDTNGDTTDMPLPSARGNLYMIKTTSKGVQLNNLPAEIGTSYDKKAASSILLNTDSKVEGLNVSGGSYKIADDAVVFVKGAANNSYAVITGAELKSVSAADAANLSIVENEFYVKSSASGLLTRASYLAVVFSGKVADLGVTTGKEIYAYVTDTSHDVSRDNEGYVRATIWNGKENLTVYLKGEDKADYTKGTIFTYTDIDANNVITGFELKGGVTAAVYAIEGSKVILSEDESTSYKTNGDTKYLYINSNADKASEIGKTEAVALQVADKYADGKIVMDNVAYVSGDEYLELVVIDVGNNMTRGNTTDVDASAEPYTDTVSAKAGDRIEFNNDVVGKSISNVLDADGKTISSAKAGQIAFATGAGAIAVA